jgi:hypothetical protein
MLAVFMVCGLMQIIGFCLKEREALVKINEEEISI